MAALILLLAALLACGDSALEPYADALAAYDRGQAAAARGDWAAAEAAFAEASARHPGSPALRGWRAHALDQGGDPAAARALLSAAIEDFPEDPDLRYNRAALAARAGDRDAAAADLRWLYARRLLDPLVAGEDPDFAALASDPATAPLAPAPQVQALARGPAGATLRGEPLRVELEALTLAQAAVTLTEMGDEASFLRLVSVVEDVDLQGERWVRRRITVEWASLAAGEATLGPWLVAAHGSSALTDRVPVSVVDLAGSGRPSGAPAAAAPWGRTPLPSAVLAGAAPPWAGRVAPGWIALVFPPGGQGELDGEGPPPVRLELREDGQPRWQAALYQRDGPGTARIRAGGAVVLEAAVP